MWMLIILMIGNGHGMGASSIQTEFASEDLCLKAKSEIKSTGFLRTSAYCVQVKP